MDAREWLGLEPTHNPRRWYLPVVPGISTGGGFLFGGCGLGAAIAAMEGATGHVGGTEILTVNAALGSRDFPEEGQWAECPSVPPPGDCPPRESRWNVGDSILSRLDQRWADPGDGRGRCSVWTRMPDLLNVSAPALGVLGDYVPLGLGATLTNEITSNSLDNTLRVARVVPTEWVLVDIRVNVVANGFGHGSVFLWAEDGTLMATASQSALVRLWQGEGYRPATAESDDAVGTDSDS